MTVIETENLTKDYGGGRGVFDLNLSVRAGEMFGFAGTNGAGKTTTIRLIMGFIRPTSGTARVKGLDAWDDASAIKRYIGYVPGEIAFPDLKNGTAFLRSQAEFLGIKDLKRADELIARLQLDPSADLRRMSKGMKQKTALVAALMGDPEIILLDEPTTGLDPLMRAAFIDIVKEEHARGKTILMSSHMFGELESACDRVALIDRGRIADIADVGRLRTRPETEYKIEFETDADYRTFKAGGYRILRDQPAFNQVTVRVPAAGTERLLNDLAARQVRFIAEIPLSLERYFKEKLSAAGAAAKETQDDQQTAL